MSASEGPPPPPAPSSELAVELSAFGARYRTDLSRALDASHPVRFPSAERQGGEVRAFGLPEPRREPVTLGSFVGSVERGGSVNCEELVVYPHGNGTHTECVGHVLEAPRTVLDALPRGLVPALVVRIRATSLDESREAYGGKCAPTDQVVTRAALEEAIGALDMSGAALVVRTGIGSGDLSGTNPPYFTHDAIALVDERGAAHLLTDLPSIDREDDGGALSSHRALWGLEPGQKGPPLDEARAARTLTELCRLEHVPPGPYLLSLQVAPIGSDAAPSRPLLHPLERLPEE